MGITWIGEGFPGIRCHTCGHIDRTQPPKGELYGVDLEYLRATCSRCGTLTDWKILTEEEANGG